MNLDYNRKFIKTENSFVLIILFIAFVIGLSLTTEEKSTNKHTKKVIDKQTMVYFSTNSDTLTLESLQTIKEIVSNSANFIKLSGSADSVGTMEYNFKLSKARTERVKNAFKELGYKDSIAVESFSYLKPNATKSVTINYQIKESK